MKLSKINYTVFAEVLLDKVIHFYGFEADETIAFAKTCETCENQHYLLLAVFLRMFENPYKLAEIKEWF